MESFGTKIRNLRAEQSLTQKELATRLNIPTSTLGTYEQDRSEPDILMIKKLATFFNVTSDYLLNLKLNDKGLDSDDRYILNSNFDRLNIVGKKLLVTQSEIMVASAMYLKELEE